MQENLKTKLKITMIFYIAVSHDKFKSMGINTNTYISSLLILLFKISILSMILKKVT